MASYAALLSLWHTIMQIEHHPRPLIPLDKTRVRSLNEKCVFLVEFLASYSRLTTINVGRFSFVSEEIEALERRMADAAYAAEDLIDSHIVDQIHAASTTSTHINSVDFLYDGLDKVIGDLELIMNDVTKIKGRMAKIPEDEYHRPLHTNYQVPPYAAGASRGSSSPVGLDDVSIDLMDELTGPRSNRQIIPIVGMGGIGKTTLAKHVFVNPLIVYHFDILAWATVSQEFNSKQILSDILLSLKNVGSGELHEMNEHEIGEKLYKNLWGRRYLIVMDDMWSMEAWEKVSFFFPDNNNGSRIMITTRMFTLVCKLNCLVSCYFGMELLNEEKSWNLLCKSVFGKEDCPVELEEVGKKIAEKCKGLPLSIVVIGGLLAKSNPTQQQWRYIAENLNAIVNMEDNERCPRTLRLSYDQLPVALKPLFLYMGIFPEDHKIHVPTLIRLWVAEGILPPPSKDVSYEEVARGLLNELIRRNLICIHELSLSGNIKYCIIHDLLRDLCIKESEKYKFLGVANARSLNIGQSWRTQRRIGIHRSTFYDDVQSASLARSLICKSIKGSVVRTAPYRLARVLNVIDKSDFYLKSSLKGWAYPLEDIFFHLVNLRHLAIVAELPENEFPSSVYDLWNLQTLVVNSDLSHDRTAPLFDIWKMPNLRHVKVYKHMLPDPPKDDGSVVLRNLQTLYGVYEFRCDEYVVKRIPNIKKLGIIYDNVEDLSSPAYCLNNLGQLIKLESLSCSFVFVEEPSELARNLITFPHSLKKLSLKGTSLSWEDMAMKIGSLPCLEVLKISFFSFIGPEWVTVEDQFRSLKYLRISNCYDLEYWRTESSHFPCLEHLVVAYSKTLKELPSDIGDIPTLKSIEVNCCSDSVVISAKKIQNEQEQLGNEGLRFTLYLCDDSQLQTEVSRDECTRLAELLEEKTKALELLISARRQFETTTLRADNAEAENKMLIDRWMLEKIKDAECRLTR